MTRALASHALHKRCNITSVIGGKGTWSVHEVASIVPSGEKRALETAFVCPLRVSAQRNVGGGGSGNGAPTGAAGV